MIFEIGNFLWVYLIDGVSSVDMGSLLNFLCSVN